MNKIKGIVFSMVFLLFCVLLVSCYRPGTLGATGYYDAYELGINAVPVFTKVSGSDASKFDKVKLIDTDSYGRLLYSYWSDGNGTFLMICQQSKKISNYNFKLYWYDECWLAKDDPKNDFATFSEEETETLKSINDWGNPLDVSKMNSAQIYRYSSALNQEEKDRYWTYIAAKEADEQAVDQVVGNRYGQGTKYGSLIRKNNKIYTVAYAPNDLMYFVCFNPSTREILCDHKYESTAFSCSDAFAAFMEEQGKEDKIMPRSEIEKAEK